MSWFKGWRWYHWLIALALPGGMVIASAMRARAARGAPRDLDHGDVDVQRKFTIDRLIGSAKASADALRSGLKNDALAASLAGVAPGLIGPGSSPSEVADKSVEAKDLRAKIEALHNQIAHANAGYQRDHFGGQTPGQFSAYVSGLQAQIEALTTKLSGLFS